MYNLKSYTNFPLKNKESTPSYQDIASSLVATEVDLTIPSDADPTKSYWGNIVTAQRRYYWKNKEDNLMEHENNYMKENILYLKKS